MGSIYPVATGPVPCPRWPPVPVPSGDSQQVPGTGGHVIPHPQSVRVTFPGPCLDYWLGELPRVRLSPPTGLVLSSPPSRTTAQSSSFLARWLGSPVPPGRSSPPSSLLGPGRILHSCLGVGVGRAAGGRGGFPPCLCVQTCLQAGASSGLRHPPPRGMRLLWEASGLLQGTQSALCVTLTLAAGWQPDRL